MGISSLAFAGYQYEVINVEKNDSLSVRSEPSHKSNKLGALLFDEKNVIATGNAKKIGKNTWLEIEFGPEIGWVNSYYLRKMDLVAFKEALSCTGTEPFWVTKLNGSDFSFKDQNTPQTNFKLASVQQSDNQTTVWFLETKNNLESIEVVLNETKNCSDEMSDFSYKYFMTLLNKEKGVFYSGCCNKLD